MSIQVERQEHGIGESRDLKVWLYMSFLVCQEGF